MGKKTQDEVVAVVDETVVAVEDAVEVITGKSKVAKVLLFPFKFSWKRFKVFLTNFRRFTNYATDDEKGPVIRFSVWLGLKLGLLFGIAIGLTLEYYYDVVDFVINLFN